MVVGVVLGAGVLEKGLPWRSLVRVNKAARLFFKGKVDELLVCGGFTNPRTKMSEAGAMKKFLIGSGIKSSKIRVEESSRNTFENALFSKKLLNGRQFIVITDGWHRSKARRVFSRVFGVDAECV